MDYQHIHLPTVPGGATKQNLKSNGLVYYWTGYGFSYWMTYTELSDKYTWTYDWQTPQVTRFTQISAAELKTGAGGNWKIYNPESPAEVVWDFTWTKVSSVYNASLNLYNAGQSALNFTIVDNGNSSGNFKFYVADVKFADVTWNTDGTGTWWYSNGSTTKTGSWTASGK
jgi:hypothetical protein